ALVFRRGGAHLGGDDLRFATLERDRATVVFVLPARGVPPLPADPDIGAASAFANGFLFRHQRAVERYAPTRNDLDHLHGRPRASMILRSYNGRSDPTTC